MTVYAYYDANCDVEDCPDWGVGFDSYGPYSSRKELRHWLRESGWVREGDKDYCRKHAKPEDRPE